MKWKNLVLSLCCISLFSIGFSSWIYSEPSYQRVDFNVSVGDVINRVFFNITSVQTFTLGPDGLVEDYTIVNSSSIVCYFTINNSAVYEMFDSGQLKFETTLSCSDDTFISKYVDSNPIIEGATNVDYFLSGASLTNSFLTTYF